MRRFRRLTRDRRKNVMARIGKGDRAVADTPVMTGRKPYFCAQLEGGCSAFVCVCVCVCVCACVCVYLLNCT